MSIPFPFTALPKMICTHEFFHDPQFLCFCVWIFSRITYAKKIIHFNGSTIFLEKGEFVFGRKKCNEETGISEQTIRTYLKRLIRVGLIENVTVKSTNKYSVHRVCLEHFEEITNQQNHHGLTISQPSTNHKQEKEQDVKECKRDAFQESESLFPASLTSQAEKRFRELSFEERKAIIVLFKARNGQKRIEHSSSWLIKCIEGKWYYSQMNSTSQETSNHIENNRLLAKEIALKLEGSLDITCHARKDWLEIGGSEGSSYQIFYHEHENTFRIHVQSALKKLNVMNVI